MASQQNLGETRCRMPADAPTGAPSSQVATAFAAMDAAEKQFDGVGAALKSETTLPPGTLDDLDAFIVGRVVTACETMAAADSYSIADLRLKAEAARRFCECHGDDTSSRLMRSILKDILDNPLLDMIS